MTDGQNAEWVSGVAGTLGQVELLVLGIVPPGVKTHTGSMETGNVITAEVDCYVTGMRFWVVDRMQDGCSFTATVYDNETHEVLGRAVRSVRSTDPVNSQVSVVMTPPFVIPAGRTVVAAVHQVPGDDGKAYYLDFTDSEAIDGEVTSIAADGVYGYNQDPAFPTTATTVGAGTDLVVYPYFTGSPVGPKGDTGAQGPQGIQGPIGPAGAGALGIVRTVCAPPYTAVAATGGANATFAYRVLEGGTISKIRLQVGATVSGNICVAVYGTTGVGLAARPSNRKATSGSVPCPAANAVTDISLGTSVVVNAGDWMTFSVDNVTATFVAGLPGPDGLGEGQCGYILASGFPAPATLSTFTSSWYRQYYLIGVP